jgi:hypothetical protein
MAISLLIPTCVKQLAINPKFKGNAGATYHPLPAFFRLIRQDIQMNSLRCRVVPNLNRPGELQDVLYSVWFQKVFVVEVIEKYVQSLLGIDHLSFEGGLWHLETL